MPRKKKLATKAVLPKTKAESIEEEPYQADVEIEDALTTKEEPQPKIEQILKQAPRLDWNFDVAYIDNEFRKGYIHLLRELVQLYNLPYNVNNLGVLLPK